MTNENEKMLKVIATYLKMVKRFIFTGKRVCVSKVKDRKCGAPLFVNFKVGNGVLACDIAIDANRILITFFKRSKNSLVEDSPADPLLKDCWKLFLIKPNLSDCKLRDYTKNGGGWRIGLDVPKTEKPFCIALKIARLISSF